MSDEEQDGEGSAPGGTAEDDETRRRAARAISERPGSDAPARVLAALADPDWRVRKEAAASAGRLAGDVRVLAALVDALLQPDDVGLRNAAIEAFAHVGAPGAAPLIAALGRAPVTARKFVCAALGGTGPGGVGALAEMARDPDPNTATVALESLARIGGESAEEALREQLAAGDWVVRLAAMEGLAALGARVPIVTLSAMVGDPLVRRFALRLLGHAGDAAAVRPLFETLPSATGAAEIAEIVLALATLHERAPGAEVEIARHAQALGTGERAALCFLVGEGGTGAEDDVRAARAAAMVALLAREPDVLGPAAVLAARAELGPAALSALSAFGSEAVRPLLAIGPELVPAARAWALEAAAELAAAAPRDAGARGPEGPDGTARGARTEGTGADQPTRSDALGRDVQAALREALGARDEIVVHAAARGLSYWAEPADAATLVRLGSIRGGAIARAAGTALEALSHSAPQSVEIALDSAPPDRAEGWSVAVAALPGHAALEKLRAAIASGEAPARRAALLALDRVDGAEAAEVASMALADEDVDVQVAAVTVLARMRDPAAREIAASMLRVALRDDRPAVRAAAARALGEHGDPGARGAIRELLRDQGPGVALAALVALRALGGAGPSSEPELEELLVDVLGHPDAEVVKEGLRAVTESPGARKESRLALGLSHPAWDVRRLAATLLGALGTDDARDALRERAPGETDDLVRAAIETALGADPAKKSGIGGTGI